MPDSIITVESWDGDEFPVHGFGAGTRGVWLAEEGDGTDFDGMFDPPVQALYTSTAFQTGATFTGIREDPYDFLLAFHVVGTAEQPWRSNDSDFRLAWDFVRQSRIRVEVEESTRRLAVRLGSKPRIKTAHDPNGKQYGLSLIPLIGAYPRWVEPDLTDSFVTTTDTTVSGTENGVVRVSNPTPLPMWMRWVLQGTAGIRWTIPDFSWGQEELHDRPAGADVARKIVMPPLIAGEHVKIESNPESPDGQFNSDLDTEIYLRTGGVEFMYPIPPRTPPTDIPIAVSKAPIGAGVQVFVPSEWQRPWGMQ
jgi:hypothetical protein